MDYLKLEEAKSMMRSYQQDIKNLQERYGTGVRPSWVSTDIALAADNVQKFMKLIETMEQETDD